MKVKKRKNWPNKNFRENYEINEFLKYYKRLPHGRNFEIVKKSEKPDYILRDINSNEHFGVELTSVYLSDRSVPDVHMIRQENGPVPIPYDPAEVEQYKRQLLESITEKINKAATYYDTSFPLILSVYVNEYIRVHIDKDDWQSFVKENEQVFDQMSPFCEIVFWPVQNGLFSVEPE
jgi:hypothetical protein